MREEPVTVTAYPDGPLILRGSATIRGEDGQELVRTRPTVALCRCGLTSRPPLCDGSHKLTAGRRRRDGAASDDTPA
ncbi:MAG: CDGSH iron-sulfur domain-containing protein [Actinomycetota bacterium]|nr:CDGSH iron-sulfur domain-containing protein [Actinomycetota bacterium]